MWWAKSNSQHFLRQITRCTEMNFVTFCSFGFVYFVKRSTVHTQLVIINTKQIRYLLAKFERYTTTRIKPHTHTTEQFRINSRNLNKTMHCKIFAKTKFHFGPSPTGWSVCWKSHGRIWPGSLEQWNDRKLNYLCSQNDPTPTMDV